jgi:hypothetical protein
MLQRRLRPVSVLGAAAAVVRRADTCVCARSPLVCAFAGNPLRTRSPRSVGSFQELLAGSTQ